MKKQPFLLVMSIIMIVLGAISLFVNFGSLGSVGLLVAFGAPSFLYVAFIFLLLAAAAEIVAGIIGCTCYSKPDKAGKCVILGIIVAALAVLGDLCILISFPEAFNWFSIIGAVLVPVLYIVAAYIAKKSATPAA